MDSIKMVDEIENPLVEKEEELQKPKPKKILSEKQKEIGRANLAKGRETLALKRAAQKEINQKVADEMIVTRAAKLVQTKSNLDKKLKSVIPEHPEVEYDEVEERVTKKPKKKRIVYREESDSEEEVIVRKPKEKEKVKEKEKPAFRVNFC